MYVYLLNHNSKAKMKISIYSIRHLENITRQMLSPVTGIFPPAEEVGENERRASSQFNYYYAACVRNYACEYNYPNILYS
jgi:hypothetical protein